MDIFLCLLQRTESTYKLENFTKKKKKTETDICTAVFSIKTDLILMLIVPTILVIG